MNYRLWLELEAILHVCYSNYWSPTNFEIIQICYIHYLTMKRIVALAFLVLALSALQTEETHDQAKTATVTTTATVTPPVAPTPKPQPQPQLQPQTPRPTTTATTTTTTPRATVAPVAPARVNHQPHKEPGFEATAGNPFGRDPQGHKTCFQNPCYDPVGACTIPAPPAPRVNTRVNTRTSTRITPTKTAAKTSTTAAPATAQPKQGTWKPVLYVVRVNGRRARFTGFRCA